MIAASAAFAAGAGMVGPGFTSASPRRPQAGESDRGLQALFDRRIAASGIAGASAAIVRRGRPPLLLESGFASLPFHVPVSPATLFHAGSVGKHVTAVLLLRLADRGRLAIEDPVGRHCAIAPAKWRDVPIETILAHASGIPDYGGGIQWDRPFGRDAFLADAADRPLLFEPGSAWSYCNAAYTLLGYLIEDVTGSSFADNVRTMFAEAGLRDSRVDDGSAVIPNRSEPYERHEDGWRHATPMSADISSVAAGGILFSARDVPAWDTALSGGRLLSRAAAARMAAPFRFRSGRPSHYAMGWNIDSMPGDRPFLWHTGSVSGFSSFHFRAEESGVAAMILLNTESDDAAAIGLELIEAFAPGSTPLSLGPIADPEPELTAEALAIVSRARPWDQNRFAPELRIAVERTGDDAIDIFDPGMLPTSRFELVQTRLGQDHRRRRYRATGSRKVQHLMVDHSEDGAIYAIRAL